MVQFNQIIDCYNQYRYRKWQNLIIDKNKGAPLHELYTVQKVQLRESEKKYFEKIQEETPKESCESPKVQPSDVQSLPAATKPICKVSDKVENSKTDLRKKK